MKVKLYGHPVIFLLFKDKEIAISTEINEILIPIKVELDKEYYISNLVFDKTGKFIGIEGVETGSIEYYKILENLLLYYVGDMFGFEGYIESKGD